MVAIIFTLFRLSFAGIPLTAGFVGKLSLFTAAYATGHTYLVIAGVLSSAIAVFFYIRIALILFFTDSKSDSVSVVIPSFLTQIAIAISAIATLIFGIAPSLLLNTAVSFAQFLR